MTREEILRNKMIERLEQEDLCVCCMDNDEERERVADAILELISNDRDGAAKEREAKGIEQYINDFVEREAPFLPRVEVRIKK